MNARLDTADAISGNPATDIFEREWRIYRKMVDNNFLFHREAYRALRTVLDEEAPRPFRFLDVACGDAGQTAAALAGLPVAHYHGVDLSADALGLARANLAGLPCPVALHRGDLAGFLGAFEEPVDVVWIGLSLHHFGKEEKRALMRQARRITGPGGLLLVYENTSPDGEDRAGWLRRWDMQRPLWTAYDADEWRTMSDHVHAHDFPETRSRWHSLGREAGFLDVREVYAAPTDLFRLYRFRA